MRQSVRQLTAGLGVALAIFASRAVTGEPKPTPSATKVPGVAAVADGSLAAVIEAALRYAERVQKDAAETDGQKNSTAAMEKWRGFVQRLTDSVNHDVRETVRRLQEMADEFDP